MTNTAYTVWMACPAEDCEHWLPWQPVTVGDFDRWGFERWLPWQLTRHGGHAFSNGEAHRLARCLRDWWPGHLIAVRPDDGSQPVCPALMVDHYDMSPYAD